MNNDKLTIMSLCNTAKELIGQKKYRECEELIRKAMAQYPNAPEPHNLMGIMFENEGNHPAAMKHFRAAWALDPAYLPARYNLNQYADMLCKSRRDAYYESDCPDGV